MPSINSPENSAAKQPNYLLRRLAAGATVVTLVAGSTAIGRNMLDSGTPQDSAPSEDPNTNPGYIEEVSIPLEYIGTPTTIYDAEHNDNLWSIAKKQLSDSGISREDPDYFNKLMAVFNDAVRNNDSAIREGDQVRVLDIPDSGTGVVIVDQVMPTTSAPPSTIQE